MALIGHNATWAEDHHQDEQQTKEEALVLGRIERFWNWHPRFLEIAEHCGGARQQLQIEQGHQYCTEDDARYRAHTAQNNHGQNVDRA